MNEIFKKEFKIDFSTFGQKKSGSGGGGSGDDGNQTDQLIKLAAGAAAVLGLYFLNSQVSIQCVVSSILSNEMNLF